MKNLLPATDWEDVFLEKPLTFKEFLETSPNFLKMAYKTTIDFFNSIDDSMNVTEYYFQGCLGSGKSIMIYTLLAYKLYLFCLLKDAHQVLGHSPMVKYTFGILGSKKTAPLVLSSILNVFEYFPMFKQNRFELDEGPIGFSVNCNNAILRLQYITSGGRRGTPIQIISVSNQADLMGSTLIGLLGTDLIAFMQDTGISEEDLFKLIEKSKHRINTRLGEDCFLGTLLIEKEPYDTELSVIDKYIMEIENRGYPSVRVVRITPFWKVRPEGYTLDNTKKIPYFNLSKLCVEYDISNPDLSAIHIRIPTELIKNAMDNPEAFMRDYIGLPTSMIPNERMQVLRDIHSKMREYNIKISLGPNGSFYLEDIMGNKEYIQDTFRSF